MVRASMRRLFGVLVMCCWLGMSFSVSAQQVDYLDRLQPCNFTDTAPANDIIVGAVVYNFVTGTGCTENLDDAFPVASVPKLFVAGAMFEWVLENEAITFDMELTFSERYWMGGRGDCLDGATLNQRVTIGELGDVMIACSDNAATWMLMDAMGWERVNDYAASLGIDGIGPVIPYSEVDRQKLIFLDPTWERVPVAMASRFYRSEWSTGLDAYFTDTPAYSRDDEIRANQLYFENTDFNTLTPRALATYITKLTEDAPRTDNDGQIARWVFNTMLLTDRQFTAQAFPGTVSVGAKNGWDTGVRAEVNVMFDRLPDNQRVPTSYSIVFARQTDFEAPTLQPPTPSASGAINQFLLELSPVISNILYPGYIPLDVVNSRQVSTVVVNPKAVLDACWTPYANGGFRFDQRGALEACFQGLPRSRIVPGDDIGVGLVLWRLGEDDARLTFVFTNPDGVVRSYQAQRFFQQTAALYYWHPVGPEEIGTWTVEVFLNRQPVLRRQVEVTSLF
jgi:hypothetical protein